MAEKKLLDGVRILALEQLMVLPYGTAMLGDMGAEVIRVEHPDHIIDRRMGPWPDNSMNEQWWNGQGGYANWNRSKKSVCMDVFTPKGKELFLELVKKSDIVVDNFRTGTTLRLGLDHDSLAKVKPDIITLTCNAFGSTGPYKAYGSRARTIDSFCGLSYITGYEGGASLRASGNYMDHNGGLGNAYSLLLAIYHKRKTGKGLRIDASMYEFGSQCIGPAMLEVQNDMFQERVASAHPYWKAPYNVYPCKTKDRWVAICVSNDEEWKNLKTAIGAPGWADESRFDTVIGRWENRKTLDDLLSEWTRQQDHLEAATKLQEHRVPAGAVHNAEELISDPHLSERDYFDTVRPENATNVGSHSYAGRAFTGRPFRIPEIPTPMGPAPDMGEHNRDVLQGLLGLSDQDIEQLEADGILWNGPSAAELANPPAPIRVGL